MTVGDLLDILVDHPDDLEILIDDAIVDTPYLEVAGVASDVHAFDDRPIVILKAVRE